MSAKDKARENAGKAASFLQRHFTLDQLAERLPVGGFVTVSLSLWSAAYDIAPWWLVAAICSLYVVRKIEPRLMATRLLWLHSAVYIASGLAMAVSLANSMEDPHAYTLMWYGSLYMIPGLFSLSLLFLPRVLRRK